MNTVSASELNHLLGSRKPILTPLHLSIPLVCPRRLTADEAAQICERGTTIQPTTRESWQIEPFMHKGRMLAALSRMGMRGGRHAEATWNFPVSEGVGLLRLSCPVDGARRLTEDECRQLRSFDRTFAGANPAWSVTLPFSSPQEVRIFRYHKRKIVLVGKRALSPSSLQVSRPESKPRPLRQLSAHSQACLSVLL